MVYLRPLSIFFSPFRFRPFIVNLKFSKVYDIDDHLIAIGMSQRRKKQNYFYDSYDFHNQNDIHPVTTFFFLFTYFMSGDNKENKTVRFSNIKLYETSGPVSIIFDEENKKKNTSTDHAVHDSILDSVNIPCNVANTNRKYFLPRLYGYFMCMNQFMSYI